MDVVAIFISAAAQAQFDDLPLTMQARMWRLVERLRNWPEVSGVKALRGDLAGRFRMRTGDYRMQFSVQSTTVAATRGRAAATEYTILIEKVGHRDGFYDE